MKFDAIQRRQNALLLDKKKRLERYLSVLRLQHSAIVSEDAHSAETYGKIASFCLQSVFAVNKPLTSLKTEFGEVMFDDALAKEIRGLEEKIFDQTEANINLAQNLTESLYRQLEMQRMFFSRDFFQKKGGILEIQA